MESLAALWEMINRFYEAVDSSGNLIFDDIPGEEDLSFRVPLLDREIDTVKDYVDDETARWAVRGEKWKCVFFINEDTLSGLEAEFDGDHTALARDVFEAKLTHW